MHISPFYTILCVIIFLRILATELQSITVLLCFFACIVFFFPHVSIGFTIYHEFQQLEDGRNVGESSYKSGDGTDQRVQSLIFMMMNFFCFPLGICFILVLATYFLSFLHEYKNVPSFLSKVFSCFSRILASGGKWRKFFI